MFVTVFSGARSAPARRRGPFLGCDSRVRAPEKTYSRLAPVPFFWGRHSHIPRCGLRPQQCIAARASKHSRNEKRAIMWILCAAGRSSIQRVPCYYEETMKRYYVHLSRLHSWSSSSFPPVNLAILVQALPVLVMFRSSTMHVALPAVLGRRAHGRESALC